jgi:hypothetical protein
VSLKIKRSTLTYSTKFLNPYCCNAVVSSSIICHSWPLDVADRFSLLVGPNLLSSLSFRSTYDLNLLYIESSIYNAANLVGTNRLCPIALHVRSVINWKPCIRSMLCVKHICGCIIVKYRSRSWQYQNKFAGIRFSVKWESKSPQRRFLKHRTRVYYCLFNIRSTFKDVWDKVHVLASFTLR